jgi:hypothetical protein
LPTQRIYKTNLAFEPTLTKLAKEYGIPDAPKGHATFRLPEFPEIPVQITTNGFVQILGGKVEIDEQILGIIAPHVTTGDSSQFHWELHKRTKGEKELRENLDIEGQRRLLQLFLDILEHELQPFGDESGFEELKVAHEVLTTLRAEVEDMDSQSISVSIREVREALSGIERLKDALDPSVWWTPSRD